MKKYFYSFVFAIVCCSSAVVAQNIKIMDTSKVNTLNGTTITLTGDVNTTLLSARMWVINKSGSTMTVKVKRDTISTVSSTSNYFCWTSCYAPSVSVSPLGISIANNDTVKAFYGDYQPYGIVGTTTVIYSFFDQSNVTDSSWVKVKFVINPLSVAQISANSLHMSALYPNPASGAVSFNYHISSVAHLTMYNSIGQSVKDILLNSAASKANLNVSDVPSGIYICKLSAEGAEPVFQKLVVSH